MDEIRVYETPKDNTIKVFFSVINGEVKRVTLGNKSVVIDKGYQFYIDDYVADQIEKCELYIDGVEPKLRVKEGEILFIPSENEEYLKQKEIQELEEKLNKLKNEK